MEEQAAQAKQAAADAEEAEEDECFEHGNEKNRDAIPKKVGKLLTHSCRGVYDLIDNGMLAPKTPLEPSADTCVMYQDALVGDGFPKEVVVHYNQTGPIALLYPEENSTPAPPAWWNQCLEQLQSKCVADIPENTTPSSYVTRFHPRVFVSVFWFERFGFCMLWFLYFSTPEVFSDPSWAVVSKFMGKFDWLFGATLRLSHQFPQANEQAVLKTLKSLAVHRYQPGSFSAGITDFMTGKVILCMKGARLYLGMPVEIVASTFVNQFASEPSLQQCASWLHQMPLELIMEKGFYAMVCEGDVLIVPPAFVLVEAGMNFSTDPCDVISWPCLLPHGCQWRLQYKDVRKTSVLQVGDGNAPSDQVINGIRFGMDVLEKLLFLSDVKPESEELKPADKSDKGPQDTPSDHAHDPEKQGTDTYLALFFQSSTQY